MSNRLLFRDPAGRLQSAIFPPAPVSFRAMIRAAWRRHRSRRQIACLDGHVLKDIGISFAEAEAEANKPFWRL